MFSKNETQVATSHPYCGLRKETVEIVLVHAENLYEIFLAKQDQNIFFAGNGERLNKCLTLSPSHQQATIGR